MNKVKEKPVSYITYQGKHKKFGGDSKSMMK